MCMRYIVAQTKGPDWTTSITKCMGVCSEELALRKKFEIIFNSYLHFTFLVTRQEATCEDKLREARVMFS